MRLWTPGNYQFENAYMLRVRVEDTRMALFNLIKLAGVVLPGVTRVRLRIQIQPRHFFIPLPLFPPAMATVLHLASTPGK